MFAYMKEYLSLITYDKIIRWGTILSSVIILLALLYAGFLFRKLPLLCRFIIKCHGGKIDWAEKLNFLSFL